MIRFYLGNQIFFSYKILAFEVVKQQYIALVLFKLPTNSFLIRNAWNAFWIIVGARFHSTCDTRCVARELDWELEIHMVAVFRRRSTGQILNLGFLFVLPSSHSDCWIYDRYTEPNNQVTVGDWNCGVYRSCWTKSTLEIQNRNRSLQVSNICWPTLEICEQAFTVSYIASPLDLLTLSVPTRHMMHYWILLNCLYSFPVNRSGESLFFILDKLLYDHLLYPH